MRIKLKLRITNSKTFPYNYNYYFSSIIYSLLKSSSEKFANQLHDEGFKLDGKTYKLFTFALRLKDAVPNKDYLELVSTIAELYISSPLNDGFMSNLISGTLKIRNSEINLMNSGIIMKVERIDIFDDPLFSNRVNFRLLSPLILSTRKLINEKSSTYYFRYTDSNAEINRILTNNLRNKYLLICKEKSLGNVELSWDYDYINKRLNENKYLSTKITIDTNNRSIDVIGMNIPFTLTGDPELIKTGYECGFGEKNSMGFGMTEIV